MNRNRLLSAAVAATFCITSPSVITKDDKMMQGGMNGNDTMKGK